MQGMKTPHHHEAEVRAFYYAQKEHQTNRLVVGYHSNGLRSCWLQSKSTCGGRNR